MAERGLGPGIGFEAWPRRPRKSPGNNFGLLDDRLLTNGVALVDTRAYSFSFWLIFGLTTLQQLRHGDESGSSLCRPEALRSAQHSTPTSHARNDQSWEANMWQLMHTYRCSQHLRRRLKKSLFIIRNGLAFSIHVYQGSALPMNCHYILGLRRAKFLTHGRKDLYPEFLWVLLD